jgi:DNA repair exonuclease SbcCD nuclease subunit
VRKPKAVLISDIHFNLTNLEVASQALRAAQLHAARLDVPLIIAGDLLDNKAIIRAEVANRVIEILEDRECTIYIIVGNHDLINEKGSDHALQFLRFFCGEIIEFPVWDDIIGAHLVPYMNDLEALQLYLTENVEPGETLIMHQGVQTADMGHYVLDRTSLPLHTFSGLRVVSGHYHKAQDLPTGDGGLFSYIGSPYTVSFSEAKDGPKGYRVLYDDNSLELVPLNLRRHVIIEMEVSDLTTKITTRAQDLLWIKLKGLSSELSGVTKKIVAQSLDSRTDFKFDLVATDKVAKSAYDIDRLTDFDLFDAIIENTNEDSQYKQYLKRLWKSVYENIQDPPT